VQNQLSRLEIGEEGGKLGIERIENVDLSGERDLYEAETLSEAIERIPFDIERDAAGIRREEIFESHGTILQSLLQSDVEEAMKRIILAGLCALFVSSICFSGQLAEVSMPDSVSVSGKTLKLNGLGLRKKLFLKIYVAGLYLETPTHDETAAITSEEEKRVVMHFLYKKVTAKQLVDAWEEGFNENSPADIGKIKKEIVQFESWMSDLSAGQEMVFTYEPGLGTTVEIAGKKKGAIPGGDFIRSLLRVWLGAHPPTGDLKSGMLGKG
jgi:hypothetical protein